MKRFIEGECRTQTMLLPDRGNGGLMAFIAF